MSAQSHVSLIIGGKFADPKAITAHLGVEPSRLTAGDWHLDSPLGEDAPVIDRLSALVDLIEPHAERLRSLDAKFQRWIDVLYHQTPDVPLGVDWLVMPSSLMRRLGALDLSLSYEVMWFWNKQPNTALEPTATAP